MPITRTDGAERSRARHDDDLHLETRLSPALRADPSRARPPAAGERALERSLDRVAPSRDYAAFIANVAGAAGAARDAETQRRLDDLRDRFSGPYVVDGASVNAQPMFRMSAERSKKLQTDLYALGAKVGVQPFATMIGQGKPRDLVKLTQALIDAGRLPPPPGDVAARIRQMQWDYGIGVDCAGYCKEALAATRAPGQRPLPLRAPGMESFRDLDGARRASFAKISITEARPGDLITLDEVPPERFGHNVMVYSRATADAARAKALAAEHGPRMAAFLASPGPHHVLEVDSSWGAGATGSPHGGYRRDTWLYDESTKTWGYFVPGTSPRYFDTSDVGPASLDKYHGTYRPR
jgi:hypothetical protein